MTALDILLILELLILFCAGIFWAIGESLGRSNSEDQLRRSMRLFFLELWRPTVVGADPSDSAIPLDALSAAPSRVESSANEISTLEVEVSQDPAGNGIGSMSGNVLRVRVMSDPVGGEANRVVTDLLAELTGIPVYNIKLIRGHYQTHKALKLTGISQPELRVKLAKLTG